MRPRNCLNQDTRLSDSSRYSNSERRMPAQVKPWPFCFFAICFLVSNNLCAQQSLDAIRAASGLSSPLFVTAPPGDANRLFIVQQGWQIRILSLTTGVLNATPFLTVSNITTAGEEGLLGLAFDPDYATNGKFYVDCVAPGGAFGMGMTQIRQYQVSANPDIADTTPSNIKILVSFDQP